MRDPHNQTEHTKFYEILKFVVNRANIEPDTTSKKLKIVP